VAIINLRGIERMFPGTPPVWALRQVDLTISAGEYVAIVGPSGSGKSTLLNVLGLLDRPTAGVYELDGRNTALISERDRAWLRAARLGFVFQAFHLLAHRTALENVMFGGMYQGLSKRERRSRAVAALEQVGMLHRATFRPDHLSGGERQRVAVARALAVEPSILLCDEPTGNLDSANTASVLQLFDELVAGGLTMCLITHDRDVAARAQREVRIVDGQLTELAPATISSGVDE
jgi:putative ABC transport system ATP-binding protein